MTTATLPPTTETADTLIADLEAKAKQWCSGPSTYHACLAGALETILRQKFAELESARRSLGRAEERIWEMEERISGGL